MIRSVSCQGGCSRCLILQDEKKDELVAGLDDKVAQFSKELGDQDWFGGSEVSKCFALVLPKLHCLALFSCERVFSSMLPVNYQHIGLRSVTLL